MTIRIGDHLVIKRGGKLITEEEEAFNEFEVMATPEYFPVPDSKYPLEGGYLIKAEIVK